MVLVESSEATDEVVSATAASAPVRMLVSAVVVEAVVVDSAASAVELSATSVDADFFEIRSGATKRFRTLASDGRE